MLKQQFKYTYMDLALDEAKKAFSFNEVPIGAIIVNKSGDVIAQAHNLTKSSCITTNHAEILAINLACKHIKNNILTDCSLYVTAEPCLMCLGAILHSRIRRIYYGCPEPKFGAIESKYSVFEKIKNKQKNFPEIYGNLQEEECKNLLQEFFKNLR